METNFSIFTKIAQNLRSPLGIVALFLVLVYGFASLVTTAEHLEPSLRQILVWFLVIFPLVVIFVFYRLVTKYPDKLYAPSDFRDETHFLKIMEIGLRRPNQAIELAKQLAEKATEKIGSSDKTEIIKAEITKASIKTLLIPYGFLTVKVLYYSLEDKVKIEFKNKKALAIFNGVQKGAFMIDSFFQTFLDLHSRGIITISSLEPFTFSVSDFARPTVKELYEEVFKNIEDKDKIPRVGVRIRMKK
jgi:hypothetical protein